MNLFRRRAVTSVIEPEPVNDEPVEASIEPDPVGRYDGPRCWVCRDEYAEQPDGSYQKVLEGGWHYSTRIDDNGNEVPDRKLHLNDDQQREEDWFYEYAQPHHLSWVEKHGVGQPVILPPLPDDKTHPAQAYDSHPDHNEWHRGHGSFPGSTA
jgi:hypothetical protein